MITRNKMPRRINQIGHFIYILIMLLMLQDMSKDPPLQELVAKDLHGLEWRIRHIYRGTYICFQLTRNIVFCSNLTINFSCSLHHKDHEDVPFKLV